MRRLGRVIVAMLLALGAIGNAWAATFTVSSTADLVDDAPGNGVCSAGGACTLRAAVQETNALAGEDTIVVPAGTFVLTLAGGPENDAATGDLDILGPLTIKGAGMGATVIDGGGVGRVFEVRASTSQQFVLSDLTIRGGDSRAENETFAGGSSCVGGGGMCVVSANFTNLNRVTIESNVARFGGGLFTQARVNMTDVVIRANQAVGGGELLFAGGGGLLTSSGNVLVFHSTIEGNVVDGTGASLAGGGGSWVLGSGTLTVSDSTITGNQAPEGIAIYAAQATACPPSGCQTVTTGPVVVVSSTIVEAAQAAAATLRSDGISVSASIVGGSAPACAGTLQSQGYDLIETPSAGCTIAGTLTGNLGGVDPLLGPLGSHGGFTPTRPLLAGSPAIDASNPTCLSNDQRGLARPVGAQCDIGSVEGLCGNGIVDPAEQCDDSNVADLDGCTQACQVEVPHTFTVDSTADARDDVPGDGLCSAGGECTVRAAVQETNALPGPDTIVVPAGTYVLTIAGADENLAASRDLDVTDALEIVGGGADVTVIDGGGIGRVFEVRTAKPFAARDLTIQHGAAGAEGSGSRDGGAVSSSFGAPVVLERVRILDNVAADGGGLSVYGVLTLIDSVVAGNVANGGTDQLTSVGGGLVLGSADSVITGSAVFGNRIAGGGYFSGGGGFWNTGPGSVTVRNSTFSDNDGAIHAKPETLCSHINCITISGGPVRLESVTIEQDVPYVAIASDQTTLRNTIVAGTGRACSGSIASSGYNLIQTPPVSGCPITGDATGNLVGVDPLLTPLGDHGGPTPTHAPLAASPAIDAANPATPGSGGNACPTADQRGLARPIGSRCDIGAVEGTCGNGVVDAGETCDDSNLTSGDGCDANCTVFCGNGMLDPGEACDDGNQIAGDCCSPWCAFEPVTTVCRPAANDCDVAETCDGAGTCPADALVDDGTPCDDGSACTAGDACAAGTCVPSGAVTCAPCEQCDVIDGCVATPAVGCHATVAPRGSSLVLRDRPVDTSDRITWKWRGQATTETDVGDPTTTDAYTLCLFDESGSAPSLVFRASAPAGGTCGNASCWRRVESGGSLKRFKYSDRDRTPDGLATMSVAPGTDGRAKIVVGGRGILLSSRPAGLPSPPVDLPLRAQLLRGGGACWEATYSSAGVRRNQPGLTSARSD